MLQSEKFVGAWMKARGNRDELVIATKYTIAYKNTDPEVKLKVCAFRQHIHDLQV